MTLNSDLKFEEKLTLGSENDMRNLVKSNVSNSKSENLTLVAIVLYLTQKGTQELCVITLKNDAKFEEELTCTLKNDMRNLVNFDATLECLEIFTSIGSF